MPLPLTLPATLAAVYLLLPLLGLIVAAPWAGLGRIMAQPEVLEALQLSLVTATAATGCALVLGVPLAWVLARANARGLSLLRALVTVPLVLPPVVGGIALLAAFGRQGLLGRWPAGWLGLGLPFTPAGVIAAQTFVAMPFLVLSVEAAFRDADRGLEEAAATLGAGRFAVFRRITLPLIAPALTAGLALCWARALGEFGATITFAGNAPGRTQTAPVAVYLALESDPEAAIALSLVMLVVCLAVLTLLRGRWLPAGGAG